MVELRVDPTECVGMPADCYVSVRVGETQKLSKLSASRLYRFPQAGDRRYGKIEVFRRIGSCSIDVDPLNDSLREISVSCQEAGFGVLGLKVAVTHENDQAKRPSEVETAKKMNASGKVKAAKEYLAKHSLEVRLSEAMQAVLRERPDDPAEFMAAKLLGGSPTMSGGVRLPPVPRASQEEAGQPMPQARHAAQERLSPALPRPQKRPPSRPTKLQPLQKAEALPPPAASQVAPPPAGFQGPFGPFYASNFRCVTGPTLDRLYTKFKRGQPAAAAPARRAEAPGNGGGFKHLPSVGTWISASGPKVSQGPVSAFADDVPLKHLPSAATWIKPLPKHLRAAKAVPPPLAPPAPAAAFARSPSVGTWLAKRPCGPKLPQVKNEKRPSVGTWLVHRLEPEVKALAPPAAAVLAAAPAVVVVSSGSMASSPDDFELGSLPMLLPPQAVCGSAFASMGVSAGMLLFI